MSFIYLFICIGGSSSSCSIQVFLKCQQCNFVIVDSQIRTDDMSLFMGGDLTLTVEEKVEEGPYWDTLLFENIQYLLLTGFLLYHTR